MTPTLFPHQKLDWNVKNLREAVEQNDEPEVSDHLGLARALVSQGFFHGGGEQPSSEALQLARKALGEDPQNAEALTLAGMALLGMNRPEGAGKYLEQAAEIDRERPDLHLAMGALSRAMGDRGGAVRQLEFACRGAPQAWETHLLLGRALADLGRQQGNPRRLIERSQFHLVQALQLTPPHDVLAALLKDVGISCMLTGRYRDAEKFFVRLREHDTYAPVARYFLGQVAYHLGKYHNAIQHYRHVLRARPDDAKVLARIGMTWFQLREFPRAREACHQALLLDPQHLTARHALGCTLLEEGDVAEALKTFRETLRDHPGHLPSYIEMVRTRRVGGDTNWLLQALRAEVGGYDRLPHGGQVDARDLTRQRIQVVIDELRKASSNPAADVLGVIDLTQDEGLRFMLWEGSLGMVLANRANETAAQLREPGSHYGVSLGVETLVCAEQLPDPLLTGGLVIEEEDLKRNAVNRHGPASDVERHRQHVDRERIEARTYQALLLLAMASRRSVAGRAILSRWAENADPDLAAASWTGLALYGDANAANQLMTRAATHGASHLVSGLLSRVTPPQVEAHIPEGGDHTQCTTCGRHGGEVDHFMAGGSAVVCDRCISKISKHRRSLPAEDGTTCNLCGRGPFEVTGLYGYNGITICSNCIERSLGLLEREEVERFLQSC